MPSRFAAVFLLAALLPLGCGGNGGSVSVNSAPTVAVHVPLVAAKYLSDPRLADHQAYQNIAPSVRYVGDAACTSCHRKIAKAHSEHPHARSLAPVAEAPLIERFDTAAHNPFDALGFRCTVTVDGSTGSSAATDGKGVESARGPEKDARPAGRRMIHQVTRLRENGTPLAELAVEVQYILGSGRSGRAYLADRDGFLVESPLSWYSHAGRWDMSPGYAEASPHFERRITAICLFCHSNGVEPIAGTENRFKRESNGTLFHGHGIGCERCHGPGERHVEVARKDEPTENTIVNPARLEPALREAVCQQCHLQGAVRVPRLGREVFDYRPGLPLYPFWSIFEPTPERAGPQKAVGHVEQLQASRCFQASKGRMGCISCHDAHRLPTTEERVAYYRDRCLTCHGQEKNCSLPLADRQKESQEDSCIQCHMTRFRAADIAHTAATDHRILRRPNTTAPAKPSPYEGLDAYVPFYNEVLSPDERLIAHWDLLVDQSGRLSPGPLGRYAGSPVAMARGQALLPKIDEALAELGATSHAEARWTLLEAKGCALWLTNHPIEAIATFEAVLTEAPERETALDLAGTLAFRNQHFAAAAGYWKRAAQVNPWRWRYPHQTAEAYACLQAWPQAVEPCQKALQLIPSGTDTRLLLVGCWLGLGERQRAQREFDQLMEMQPPNADELRKWFAKRTGRR